MNASRIRRLIKNIENAPENAEPVLKMAGESAENNKIAVKSAIHYENLGDPGKCEILKKLILELERLEHENPSLRWKQNVPSTLTRCLASWHDKKKELTKEKKAMHDARAAAAKELLRMIAKARPLKVLCPLIASLQNEHARESAIKLMCKIYGKKLGNAGHATMKKFSRVVTAAIKDENSRDYAVKLLEKVIRDGGNDLIYFVAPLISAMENPAFAATARELLDTMKGKRLGEADSETMRSFTGTVLRAMRDGNTRGYAVIFLKKAIGEEQNDLIYFVAPLLCAMKNPAFAATARGLLDEMRGKRLGWGYPGTIKDLAWTGAGAIKDKTRWEYATTFLRKIIDEGENDLIHLVAPLIGVRGDRYPACRGIAKELLNTIKDRELGEADSKTLEEIEGIFQKAVHSPKKRRDVLLFSEKLGLNVNSTYEGPSLKKKRHPGRFRKRREREMEKRHLPRHHFC